MTCLLRVQIGQLFEEVFRLGLLRVLLAYRLRAAGGIWWVSL